ncbi:DUF2007 domain-containing protein [Flavivirga eckloniae]|nr:DUF2007 domain-containing protein [Flavivirga eckloniae]
MIQYTMEDSNYIKIFTGDFIIVQRIIDELKAINIHAIVKDTTESARLAGFGGGILPGFQEVFVNKDELDQAVLVVQSITSQLDT